MIKKSRQRDAILSFIVSRKDHPTAKAIYDGVKEVYPNISLGTVYRNLSLLEELGQIIRIPCSDDKEHYDGNTTPHYHFMCNCCRRIIDMEIPALDFVEDLASHSYNGSITGHHLTFYGLCEDCKEKT